MGGGVQRTMAVFDGVPFEEMLYHILMPLLAHHFNVAELEPADPIEELEPRER